MYDLSDPEALYNVRAALPDHPATLARWATESAEVRKRFADQARFDLAYGPSDAERVDLFLPTTDGPHPVVVLLHGGYWQALDKSDHSFLAPAFLDAGVAFAVVNYGLCPAVTLEDIVAQTRRALAWVWRRGPELGLDRSRIQVAGHSAGAHLAVCGIVTNWPSEAEDLPPHLFQSLVGVSGVYDLNPLVGTTINDKLGLDTARATTLSPVNQRPMAPARTLLAVGEKESVGFHHQSDSLRDRWERANPELVVMTLFGRDHLSAVEAFGEAAHPLHQRALELLDGR